jgi:6-phosphogluconolactonase
MQITRFEPNSLAETLLERWQRNGGPISFGIPGGRSPGKLLTPLAGLLPKDVSARLHLFWVDERCVPIGGPDRNDEPTLKAWTEGGSLPGSVWPMPAHLEDLNAACEQYDQQLKDLGFGDGLDVALLGIGPDGHFASLFPDQSHLEKTERVFWLQDSPKPPPKRLSLSLSYLLKSSRIDVLVMGKDKGEILRKGVDQPGPSVPVSLLLDHNDLHLHLDEEAQRGFESNP